MRKLRNSRSYYSTGGVSFDPSNSSNHSRNLRLTRGDQLPTVLARVRYLASSALYALSHCGCPSPFKPVSWPFPKPSSAMPFPITRSSQSVLRGTRHTPEEHASLYCACLADASCGLCRASTRTLTLQAQPPAGPHASAPMHEQNATSVTLDHHTVDASHVREVRGSG